MNPDPTQMTIWLVVPSGLSMGDDVAGTIFGAVTALSAAVIAVRQTQRAEEGTRSSRSGQTPAGPVAVPNEAATGSLRVLCIPR
jgi:crotonobetainyl-CoA:carnitine CoA-transferase CaiB-like acyl-CoA transferase